ncbi:MAG: hypothetical protein QGF53_04375 [Alphaproteobacteria bacterium]|nr:hypothetical protein [Alphaproteobacteria bacterium]
MSEGPLRLRPATPADLPQLEAWCATLRPDERPPFIAATLAEFEQAPARGTLLIVEDGDREMGFVVLSRLWSNRARGEIAVFDDVLVEASVDAELLRHEVETYAKGLGIDQVTDSANLM